MSFSLDLPGISKTQLEVEQGFIVARKPFEFSSILLLGGFNNPPRPLNTHY